MMNTPTRNSLVQAAALAAVWVVASAFAGQTAPVKNEARHPALAVSTAFEVLEQTGQYSPARHKTGAAKGDMQVGRDACQNQAWPYISAACVTGRDPAREISRTITIEKRGHGAGSTLVRVATETQIAAR